MSITNRVFLDSSFFTEGYKGIHLKFYKFFNTSNVIECRINAIVCTKHWFSLFGLPGGASPLALTENKRISSTVHKDINRFTFFRDFHVLQLDNNVVELAFTLIQKHGLLSNDSLILASCLQSNIPYLVSHDSDFQLACKAEGIQCVTPTNYADFFY